MLMCLCFVYVCVNVLFMFVLMFVCIYVCICVCICDCVRVCALSVCVWFRRSSSGGSLEWLVEMHDETGMKPTKRSRREEPANKRVQGTKHKQNVDEDSVLFN
jgi:hypothetical protein